MRWPRSRKPMPLGYLIGIFIMWGAAQIGGWQLALGVALLGVAGILYTSGPKAK